MALHQVSLHSGSWGQLAAVAPALKGPQRPWSMDLHSLPELQHLPRHPCNADCSLVSASESLGSWPRCQPAHRPGTVRYTDLVRWQGSGRNWQALLSSRAQGCVKALLWKLHGHLSQQDQYPHRVGGPQPSGTCFMRSCQQGPGAPVRPGGRAGDSPRERLMMGKGSLTVERR